MKKIRFQIFFIFFGITSNFSAQIPTNLTYSPRLLASRNHVVFLGDSININSPIELILYRDSVPNNLNVYETSQLLSKEEVKIINSQALYNGLPYTGGVMYSLSDEILKVEVYKNGFKFQNSLTYWKSGNLSTWSELNNEGTGFEFHFHENGNVDYSSYSFKGMSCGDYYQYRADGTREMSVFYTSYFNDQQRNYVTYHENGVVEKAGSYDDDGKPNGLVMEMDCRGQIFQIKNYDHGKADFLNISLNGYNGSGEYYKHGSYKSFKCE